MTSTLRQTLLCSLLCLTASCQVKNEALRVEVVAAVLPDATCGFTTSNPVYTQGYYDPTVDGAQGYALTVLMRNNMQVPLDDVITLPQTTNINRQSHDVQVTSFDACWYFADAVDNYSSKNAGGQAVDCSSIPGQSVRLPANGRIDEGGGLGLVQTRILTLDHLRALFGAAYAPSAIPALGRLSWADPSINPEVANGNQTTAQRHAYLFSTEDPGNPAGRSAAWGDRYPARRDAAVVVQLRANLQLQSGEQMHSNWFSMPVTVCTGCMQDYCGPLIEEVCAKGPCPDGTECLSSGQCADSSMVCSPVTLYSGARPDFYGQTGVAPCYPAQAFSSTAPLTCTDVGCRATN